MLGRLAAACRGLGAWGTSYTLGMVVLDQTKAPAGSPSCLPDGKHWRQRRMKGCLQLHPRGRMEGFTEGPNAGEAPSPPTLPHPHGCMLGQGESCCPDEPLSPSACCQDRSALCRLSVIRLAGGSRLGLEGSRFYPLKGRRAAQSSAGGPSHGDGISPSILVRPGRQRCPNPLGGLDPDAQHRSRCPRLSSL